MFNNFLLAVALGVNSNVVPNHYSTNSSFKSFENLNEINQLNFNIDGVKITNESGLPDSIHQQFLQMTAYLDVLCLIRLDHSRQALKPFLC